MTQPVAFVWKEVADPDEGTGELVLAMVPVPRYRNVAKRQFGEPGSEHVLEPIAERSMASHSQYFAALKDAFDNLPENVAHRWPTVEHFRKYLLILADKCETRWIACRDEEHAAKTALFMREVDEFAVIGISKDDKTVVVVKRAKSQSMRAMGKREFEESKRAVLDLAERFTGVSRTQAMREAGRSA